MSEETTCPNCGKSFKSITVHWGRSSECSHPRFSEGQVQVLEALFMCGGSFVGIDDVGKNPTFRLSSVNERFLRWLKEQFPMLSRPVTQILSEEESRKSLEERFGKTKSGDDLDTSAVYVWETVSNPHILDLFGRWTDFDENRRVPEDYVASPLMLAVLNAFQGHLTSHGSDGDAYSVTFHVSATPIPVEDWVRVLSRFEPSVHHQYDREVVVLRDSARFFDVISNNPVTAGHPIPGGEGAWPSSEKSISSVLNESYRCPSCGNRFDSLGKHWSVSDCSPHSLSSEQVEFVKGMLLLRNSLAYRETERPSFVLTTSNERFAEWFSDWLGVLANRPVERVEEFGENPWGIDSGESTFYTVKTRRLPELAELKTLYDDGEKCPQLDSLARSPALIRGMYSSVGSLQKKSNPFVIPMFPAGRVDVPDSFFRELLSPFKPAVVHNPSSNHRYVYIRDREAFFEFLGECPDGLEDKWLDVADLDDDIDISVCPTCGNSYYSLGSHWASSTCSRPDLSSEQVSVTEALFMCGGRPNKDERSSHPRLVIASKSLVALEFLDAKFGSLSSGISIAETSDDSHVWRSHPHPVFSELYGEWGADESSVKNQVPSDFRLTPICALVLYLLRGEKSDEVIMFRREKYSPSRECISNVLREVGEWSVSYSSERAIRLNPASEFLEYISQADYDV